MQARPPIKIPVFDFRKLAARDCACHVAIREQLVKLGAVRLRVPDTGKLHRDSLRLATRFFQCDDDEKGRADGRRIYRSLHGNHHALVFAYAGIEHRVLLADYLGGERGWVGRGTSPSKADKEYFQWGVVKGARPGSISDAKCNFWPDDAEFRFAKEMQLRVHSFVHSTMLSTIWPEITNHEGVGRCPIEVICRDTRYFVPAETDIADTEQHIARDEIINQGHADLSNGTLISYADGLQIYVGVKDGREDILEDEQNWCSIDWSDADPDDLLYVVGLASEIQTCGRYRAAWHRVVRKSSRRQERLSTVSFCNAGVDDVLSGGVGMNDATRFYPSIPRAALPLIGSGGYMTRFFRKNGRCATERDSSCASEFVVDSAIAVRPTLLGSI